MKGSVEYVEPCSRMCFDLELDETGWVRARRKPLFVNEDCEVFEQRDEPTTTEINYLLPLPFERLPGSLADPTYDTATSSYSHWGKLLAAEAKFTNIPSSERCVFDAKWLKMREVVLESYVKPAAEAEKAARAALQMHPHVSDAFNLLVLTTATSHERALELYEHGVQAGNELLGPNFWTHQQMAFKCPCCDRRHGYEMQPVLRGWIRSMQGVMVTCVKMKRWKEAFQAMTQVQRLQTMCPTQIQSFANTFALAPLIVYKAYGAAAALSFFETLKPGTEKLLACSALWVGTYALARFAQSPGSLQLLHLIDGWDENDEDEEEEAAVVDTVTWCSKRCWALDGAMSAMVLAHPLMVDYLLGDRPLPRGHMPGLLCNPEGAYVVFQAQAAWLLQEHYQAVPGVLDTLRRVRNSCEVCAMMRDARWGLDVDLQELDRRLAGGTTSTYCVCSGGKDGVAYSMGQFMFHGRHINPALTTHTFSPTAVEVLTRVLRARCLMQPPPFLPHGLKRWSDWALRVSCTWRFGPEVVKVLLEEGGEDPISCARYTSEPTKVGALMACVNEGAWRELRMCLRHLAKTRDLSHIICFELWPQVTASMDILTGLLMGLEDEPPGPFKLEAQAQAAGATDLLSVLALALPAGPAGNEMLCGTGREPCVRCTVRAFVPVPHVRPHGKPEDYERCLDEMLDAGLRVTPGLIALIKDVCKGREGAGRVVSYLQSAAAGKRTGAGASSVVTASTHASAPHRNVEPSCTPESTTTSVPPAATSSAQQQQQQHPGAKCGGSVAAKAQGPSFAAALAAAFSKATVTSDPPASGGKKAESSGFVASNGKLGPAGGSGMATGAGGVGSGDSSSACTKKAHAGLGAQGTAGADMYRKAASPSSGAAAAPAPSKPVAAPAAAPARKPAAAVTPAPDAPFASVSGSVAATRAAPLGAAPSSSSSTAAAAVAPSAAATASTSRERGGSAAGHHCWTCGATGVKLRKCERCRTARYCSGACQAADWADSHKKRCKELAAAKEAAAGAN